MINVIESPYPHSMTFLCSACKGTAALRHRCAVIVFLAPPLRSAATARVDSDHREDLTALLDDFTQRAQASSEVGSHLDETTAFWKPAGGFFLRGSPLKPAVYLMPMHVCLMYRDVRKMQIGLW
jgi:hypothetical protein